MPTIIFQPTNTTRPTDPTGPINTAGPTSTNSPTSPASPTSPTSLAGPTGTNSPISPTSLTSTNSPTSPTILASPTPRTRLVSLTSLTSLAVPNIARWLVVLATLYAIRLARQIKLSSLSNLVVMTSNYLSSNALVASMVVPMLLSGIYDIKNKLVGMLSNLVSNCVSKTVVISRRFDPTTYESVAAFVAKLTSNPTSRITFDGDYLLEDQPVQHIPTGSCQHVFRFNDCWVRTKLQDNLSESRNDMLTIQVLAGNQHVVDQLVRKALQDQRESQKKPGFLNMYKYNFEYEYWKAYDIRQRMQQSIVMPGQMVQLLLDDAAKFFASKQHYLDHQLPHRRGYLFYGAPGNGKTSMVQVLASHLKLDICLVCPSKFPDDDALCAAIHNSPPGILLLEDIDAALDKKRLPGDDQPGVSLSGLLNMLDGVNAQQGRLVIMTTNNSDMLDWALTRPGRCDLKVKFDLPDTFQITRLAKQFYQFDQTNQTDRTNQTGQPNQSDPIGQPDQNQTNQTNQPNQTNQTNQPGQPDQNQTNQPDQPNQPNQPNQSNQSDPTGQPDQPDQSNPAELLHQLVQAVHSMKWCAAAVQNHFMVHNTAASALAALTTKQPDQLVQPNQTDQTNQPNQIDQTVQTDQTIQTDQPVQSNQPDQPDQPNQLSGLK